MRGLKLMRVRKEYKGPQANARKGKISGPKAYARKEKYQGPAAYARKG